MDENRASMPKFEVGQWVRSAHFGDGQILGVLEEGTEVSIKFSRDRSVRTLVITIAQLQLISKANIKEEHPPRRRRYEECVMCGDTLDERLIGGLLIETCGNCGAKWFSGDAANNNAVYNAVDDSRDNVSADDDDDEAPQKWASDQIDCGNKFLKEMMDDGDPYIFGEFLSKVTDCYDEAMTVFTQEEFLQVWAKMQYVLGDAYAWAIPEYKIEEGNPYPGLEYGKCALDYYKEALCGYTETNFPEVYAEIQTKQGNIHIGFDPDITSRDENLRQAIECYKEALRVYIKNDFLEEAAEIQEKLGNIFHNLPTGNADENLGQAIEYYNAALKVYTLEHPSGMWAKIQNKLGIAYYNLTTGNQDENLKKAIEYYTAALSVRDDRRTLFCLGKAYIKLSTGDQNENKTQAIRCLKAALQLYDDREQEYRAEEYANIQLALGRVYCNLTFGDPVENWCLAIKHFEAALKGINEDESQKDWAEIQYNLGQLYSSPPHGDKEEYQTKAYRHFEATLSVYTKTDSPENWAIIQYKLGELHTNPLDAIARFDDALCVITKEESSQFWGEIQIGLGRNHFDVKESDYGRNIESDYLSKHKNEAILCYKKALGVFNVKDFPEKWAKIQYGLGNVYRSMNTEDQCENQSRAIDSYNAALLIYTEQPFKQEWANIQNALGSIFCKLTSGDRHQNQSRAIECFTSALRVLTEKSSHQEWANIQYSLGYIYSTPPTSDQVENQMRAIEHYMAALRIFTAKEKAETQITIGDIFCKLTTGDRRENQIRAIEFYTAALRLLTRPIFGREWEWETAHLVQSKNFNIDLPKVDPSENPINAIENFGAELRAFFQQISQNKCSITTDNYSILIRRALECYSTALHVFTETDDKRNWAEIQFNIGSVYSDLRSWATSKLHLGSGHSNQWNRVRDEYQSRATEYYNAALRVYTDKDFPEQNKKIQDALAAFQPNVGFTFKRKAVKRAQTI